MFENSHNSNRWVSKLIVSLTITGTVSLGAIYGFGERYSLASVTSPNFLDNYKDKISPENDFGKDKNSGKTPQLPTLLTQASGGGSCSEIPGAATPQADAITWTDGNFKIFTIGNNINTLGFQESGFEQEAYSRGRSLVSLNGSSDYNFTGATGPGSATSSVGTFSNGTLTFSTTYITTNRSEFRTTTANSFISGSTGHGVYIFPEQGGTANDSYTVSIDFTTPVTAFSLDLVDIFDTLTNNNPIISYEVYVDGQLIAYFNGPFLGDDQVGAVNLYDGSNTLRGSPNTGQNIENTIGFVTDTPVSNVSIRHVINSGSILNTARDPHGIDRFTYSTDLPLCDYSDTPEDGQSSPNGGTTGYGDATHIIVNDIKLGLNIDNEIAAQNSPDADGDDNDSDGDDDDGINIPTTLTAGQIAKITANVTGTGGYLQGWIDWDGDGSFDAGEQVATDIQDNSAEDSNPTLGTVEFDVTVPAGAITSADTFARFRWSTTQGLDSTTDASDGEVEDYQVAIAAAPSGRTPAICMVGGEFADWTSTSGDNRSGTGTFVAAPNVAITPDFTWTITGDVDSSRIDSSETFDNGTQFEAIFGEANNAENINFRVPRNTNSPGQPISNTLVVTIDFAAPTPPDALGFSFIDLESDQVRVRAKDAAGVDVPVSEVASWFVETFDANTSDGVNLPIWDESEAALVGYSPTGPAAWQTVVRSNTVSNEAGGGWFQPDIAITQLTIEYQPADQGASPSIHMHMATCTSTPTDYSDAPADGGTAPDGSGTTGYGEASHIIVSGIKLGTNIDAETVAQSSPGADGDDNDGTDDDDGIDIPTLTPGQTATITATVAEAVAGTGRLQGWIDWDGDGSFDAGEQVAADIQDNGTGDSNAASGTIEFNVNVPAGAITSSDTFARFRWSTTQGLDSTTDASDGEVEDYQVAIAENSTTPFSCNADILFSFGTTAGNPVTLRQLSQTGANTFTIGATLNSTSSYNALGYNIQDNLAYAITADTSTGSTINKTLVSIDANGTVTNLGEITGLPATSFFRYIAGDVDQNGRLYVAEDLNGFSEAMDTIYVIDIDSLSVTSTITLSPTISVNSFINDLTYNHVDDFIYAFNQDFKLYKIDPTTGAVTTLSNDTTNIPGSGSNVSSGIFGAVFTDVFGNLYGIDNLTGDLYQFDTTTGEGIFIGTATTGSFNDGTHCHNAEVVSFDYGDAPDTGTGTSTGNYNTTIFDDGARHFVPASPTVYLGTTAPDFDSSLLQDATASADNNNGTADEDGVQLDGITFQAQSLAQGDMITLDITTTGSGVLNAWIDWNGNGNFTDAGEQIAINAAENGTGDSDTGTAGIQLNVSVPNGATAGDTYARFRYSTDTGLTPTGTANDGEVEDYQVAIASDPISPLAGQLIINEVLYAQTGNNSAAENDEFIELFNASSNSIDLSGFQLIDGNLLVSVNDDPAALDSTAGSITGNQSPYVFPNGTILQPGEYAVIWIGDQNGAGGSQIPERFASGAVFQDWLGSAPKLNNTGDDVWLYDADTKVIDYIAYGTGTGINTRPDPTLNLWDSTYENRLDSAPRGQSISLTPNGQDGNTSACWEKTAIATISSDSASGRCAGFLETRDTDTAVVNGNERITSVGENNNGTRNPELVLVKRITNLIPNPNSIDFTAVVDDGISGSDDDDPNWQNNFLQGQINVADVQPEDEVEYTIYFLSNGTGEVNNVKICDVVPDNMNLVENGFGNDMGMRLFFDGTTEDLSNIANDDQGEFYSPNTVPPTFCQKIEPSTGNLVSVDSSNNNSGAVVIELDNPLPSATGSGTPSDSYGYIRFRVRVE